MTQPRFEVWLRGFAGQAPDVSAQALSRVFGIEEEAAVRLMAALPRVVKRDATIVDAQQIVDALTAIGGDAEVFAAGAVGAVGAAGAVSAVSAVNAASAAAPNMLASTRTSATVKIGSLDLRDYGMTSWPTPEPVAQAAASPASQDAASPLLSYALSSPLAANSQVSGYASVTPGARISLAPLAPPVPTAQPVPLSPLASPAAASAARPSSAGLLPMPPNHDAGIEAPLSSGLELASASAPDEAMRASLALPAVDTPCTLPDLRRPSERLRLPPSAANTARARASSRPLVARAAAPVALTAGILRQAERSSLQHALQGHPFAGFLMILTATTLVFLALLAVL